MSGTLRGEIWGLSFAVAHSDTMGEKHAVGNASTFLLLRLW